MQDTARLLDVSLARRTYEGNQVSISGYMYQNFRGSMASSASCLTSNIQATDLHSYWSP